MKVRDLISLNQLKLVYDFTQNSLPSDLMDLFSFSSDIHTVPRELNSSVNKLIYIPRVITKTYGIDSIRYKCATLGNKYFKNWGSTAPANTWEATTGRGTRANNL